MRLYLHVGAKREHIDALDRAAQRLPAVVETYRDGDSWEEWGEPIGRPQYEGREHLVIAVSDATTALAWAVRAADALAQTGRLLVSRDAYRITWAITPADDWSDVVLTSDTRAALAGVL